MSNILIQIAVADQPLAAGQSFGQTNLLVTDSSGVPQSFALTGKETPPWSQIVTVADGDLSAVATAVDSTGATLGTPVSGTFTAGTKPAGTFSAPSGMTITQQ